MREWILLNAAWRPNRGGRGCAVIVWLASCTLCPADTPDSDQTGVHESRTVLNQGASIEDAARLEMGAGDVADDKVALEPTDPVVPEQRGGLQTRRTGRNVRPSKRQVSAMSLSGDKPLPWYQTGLGALVVVLGLIGGSAWALKRWVLTSKGGSSNVLQVVSRASLSPKHSVALVRLGRRFVMVGIAGEQVSMLCEVNDPDEVAELAIRTGESVDRKADDFEQLLLEETADYPSGEETLPKRSTPVRLREGRQPLSELLRRLKSVQSKQ